jgi:L-ascorbate metabolism protein UlaG (beta-lactamase superfamily)
VSADSVTYVGHATVLAELDGTRLLTDPVLRSRVGPLRRLAAPPAAHATSDLDAVLISHLHHDHADLPSLQRVGRDVPLLVPRGAGTLFERAGFSAVAELSPGDSETVGALNVTAVEAEHPGERKGWGTADAIGYVLDGSHRVYFAGDTDIFDAMKDLGEGLDLALLPIWGWGPNLGAGHLDPHGAARAAALLSPRMVVPIHWGTLYPMGLSRFRPGPLRSPPSEFEARMRELAPQVETRVLAPGESVSLS